MKTKKYFIAALMAAIMPSVNVSADPIDIELGVKIFDPKFGQDDSHRTPVRVPSVFIDGNILYFNTPCDGCELRIVDCTDEVVYSIMIPDNTQRIELPDYLLGTYQLQIIRGNFCFHGDIEL